MTKINFTKGADNKYTASISGFTGVLQVDKDSIGNTSITAKTTNANEVEIFNVNEKSTIAKVDVPTSVTLKIICDTQVTLGQYEAE